MTADAQTLREIAERVEVAAAVVAIEVHVAPPSA